MDDPVVGVVGDDVSNAVADAGVEPLYGTPTTVRDADPVAVVATGASALSRLVDAGVSCPVVPVDVPGLRTVPRAAVTDAVTALLDGRYETMSVPIVVAESPLGETRALFDVMVVASEPARISEYTIRSRGDRVATLRADGVVAATPSGSGGYARRAGGPVIAPELNAVTVVPVAPFSTDAGHWVVPTHELTLTVERDETAVELLVDDRTVGEVKSGGSVRLTGGQPLAVAVVPASGGRFE
jgi:NAD+ kinase